MVATAIAPVFFGCSGDVSERAAVGRPSPDYAARTLAGDSVALKGFVGKPVLLNIWATWCDPCREEIPFLEKVYVAHHSRGLEIIGVSIDARGQDQAVRDFASQLGMTYAIWLDPDQRVVSTFNAFGQPASYLLDRRGVLRWKHVGVLRPTNTDFSAALAAVMTEAVTR
jgi:cytochrome c biogenesis protein CcmG, thiol:disulfide interchange protein DsbE